MIPGSTPLKKAIAESGRTQAWLADEVGIREATLSRLVQGHRLPSAETGLAIARALGTTFEALWGHVLPNTEAA